MKKIIKYTKGKQNTYKVLLEDEEITLYDDIVIKYELLLKKKIKEEELEKIKKENSSLESYYKALSYISRKMRTVKEIKEYLKKLEYSDLVIEKTIEKLVKENILDDKYYTEIFINDSLRLNLDGPEKIKRKLETLGIKEENYKEYLNRINKSQWEEKINQIIKKRHNHKESANAWIQKLTTYLITNGYPYELFKDKLKDLNIKNNPDIIKKEKEKLERKFSRKYNGEKLVFQLKQKLYQKGFTKEEIEEIL